MSFYEFTISAFLPEKDLYTYRSHTNQAIIPIPYASDESHIYGSSAASFGADLRLEVDDSWVRKTPRIYNILGINRNKLTEEQQLRYQFPPLPQTGSQDGQAGWHVPSSRIDWQPINQAAARRPRVERAVHHMRDRIDHSNLSSLWSSPESINELLATPKDTRPVINGIKQAKKDVSSEEMMKQNVAPFNLHILDPEPWTGDGDFLYLGKTHPFELVPEPDAGLDQLGAILDATYGSTVALSKASHVAPECSALGLIHDGPGYRFDVRPTERPVGRSRLRANAPPPLSNAIMKSVRTPYLEDIIIVTDNDGVLDGGDASYSGNKGCSYDMYAALRRQLRAVLSA